MNPLAGGERRQNQEDRLTWGGVRIFSPRTERKKHDYIRGKGMPSKQWKRTWGGGSGAELKIEQKKKKKPEYRESTKKRKAGAGGMLPLKIT